jgi:hypothetical protein
MKLTAKQKDEETTTVYSKDIISVVKLPEEFTAALLFWNDVFILQRQLVVPATL